MIIKLLLIAVGALISIAELLALVTNQHIAKRRSAIEKLRPQLIGFIKDAEKAGFKDGASKKKHVMRLAMAFLNDKKVKEDENTELLISEMVEELLELPQKKGQPNND